MVKKSGVCFEGIIIRSAYTECQDQPWLWKITLEVCVDLPLMLG